MDQGGVTWILAADATEARVFSEGVRCGPLKELPALRMTAADGERQRWAEGDQGGHTAELRFMRRVAARITGGAGEFDRLVLMGPPRALGLMKLALPAEILRRVDVTEPHERRQDDPDALRRHLRDARARTWA